MKIGEVVGAWGQYLFDALVRLDTDKAAAQEVADAAAARIIARCVVDVHTAFKTVGEIAWSTPQVRLQKKTLRSQIVVLTHVCARILRRRLPFDVFNEPQWKRTTGPTVEAIGEALFEWTEAQRRGPFAGLVDVI